MNSTLQFTWVSPGKCKLQGKEDAGNLQEQLKLVDALRAGLLKAIENEKRTTLPLPVPGEDIQPYEVFVKGRFTVNEEHDAVDALIARGFVIDYNVLHFPDRDLTDNEREYVMVLQDDFGRVFKVNS